VCFQINMETIKSIVKAAKILELFLANKEIFALKDIAESTGLNKATVSRIVRTLVNCGFLKQQKRRGKYSLGVRFMDFSDLIRSGPRGGAGAITYLTELSQLVNGSVYFVIWNGSKITHYSNLKQANYSEDTTRYNYDWTNLPLYNTSVGTLFLSSLSQAEFSRYLKKISDEQSTEQIGKIEQSIARIRGEGIAIEEDTRTGISSIAVGLKKNKKETIGAIYLTGSSSHLTRSIRLKILPTLKNCAGKISKEISSKDQHSVHISRG
jgi:DNA-binding IclR family transcriptional regulator